MRGLLRAAGAALLAAGCAGCTTTGGPRLSAAPATIEAGGRFVLVAPPEGRCVAAGAAEAATLVMGCDGAGLVAGVSLGPQALFDEAGADAAFDALAQWARGPAGGRALGVAADAPPVRLEASRREGAALFLIFEEVEGAPPRRFLRAFTEIKGRAAMVSVYDMGAGDAADAEMVAAARAQLAALRAANGDGAEAGSPAPPPPPPARATARRGGASG